VASAQQFEEPGGTTRVEGERRRQLQQQRARFAPRARTAARNVSSGSRHRASARSWLIVFGILTAKRNSAGTAAAQRA
jgi:hypothetical protein